MQHRSLLLKFLVRVFVLFAASQSAFAQTGTVSTEIVLQIGHSTILYGTTILSSDGKFVISAGQDALKLWEAESGRLIRTFRHGSGLGPGGAAASADGSRIVSSNSDNTISIWDAESGRELHVLARHFNGSGQGSLAFSPDSRLLIAGDGIAITLWDAESGRELRTFEGGNRDVLSVAFSSDGRRIISGDLNNTIKLWDADTGKELRIFTGHLPGADGHSSGAYAMFVPDGRRIVSRGSDGTVRLWDVESGQTIRSFPIQSYSIAVSPDGQQLISGGKDGNIEFWDVESGQKLRILESHGHDIYSVSFSHDGRRIISGSQTLNLWDVESGRVLRVFEGHTFPANSVTFSPNGKQLFSLNATLKCWDLQSGRLLRSLGGVSMRAALSPDGRQLASSRLGNKSNESTIRLWDTESRSELQEHSGIAEQIWSLAFSPDGRKIVAGFSHFFGKDNETIRIFEVESLHELRSLRGHSWSVTSVAFSPDGQRIVSGSADETIKLWDAESGQQLRSFSDQGDFVNSVAFSPNGRSIVSAGQNIKLWDSESGQQLRLFSEDTSGTKAAIFSPDGHRVVSAGWAMKLWDVESGREIRTFMHRPTYSLAVAFSPDGRRLASANEDGTVELWDPENGELVGTALSFLDDEWIFMTPEGFFDASSSKAMRQLNVVHGLEVLSIDQVYNTLYRPDLVREKLAGDPAGKVKAAAAKLDLTKVMASGSAPKVAITSPGPGLSSDKDEVTVDAMVTDQGGGVGKMEWRVNGVTLGIETRGLDRVTGDAGSRSGKTLTVHRSLALERGANRIEVLAYNAENLIASEPAAVIVNSDGETGASPPKLFVVAVGVNDYYDSRLKLSYAVPDATAIAEGFRKAGTGLYAAIDVTTVLDKDVTIANLDKVFTEVGSRVQPRDVFVFFLAGHGKTKNGRYYFLPRDFRYEDEDSIEKAGMDQDKFQAWFAKIPARKSVLLYDTCESGSLTGNKTRGTDIDERLGALNRMTRATGRTFLTATTDDAPALEGYHGHGVFTYAILDALDHGDLNKDGLIEVSELADYVDRKVPDISFDAFKLRQIPQRSIVGNNFALINKTEVLAAVGPTPPGNGEANQSAGTMSRPASPPVVPIRPSYVVILPATVKSASDPTASIVTLLPAGTQVQVIETGNGWVLIARNGEKIGYVEEKDLLALQ